MRRTLISQRKTASSTFKKASAMDKVEILLGLLILFYACGIVTACLWACGQ